MNEKFTAVDNDLNGVVTDTIYMDEIEIKGDSMKKSPLPALLIIAGITAGVIALSKR